MKRKQFRVVALREYRTPEMELVTLPVAGSICETSGDLEDIVEDDSGIIVWEP